MSSSLPFFARYVLSASISGGRKSFFGPATTTTDRVVGHRRLLDEDDLFGRVVVAAERGGDARCSPSRSLAAVSFSPWPCVK